MQQRSAPGGGPDVAIAPPSVADPTARFTVLIGIVWFIAWCMTALAVFRPDWPNQEVHALAAGLGLVVLLLTSFALTVRLRRLDVGARERYAAALRQTNALLRDLVDRDDLTGLRNRRFFVRYLEDVFDHAAQQGGGLALLVADLDGFKEVNDQLGHQAGDRVLREFARRLEAVARAEEFVCRIGGDEFAILAPGAGREAAENLAERVRSLNAVPPPWSADLEGTVAIHASCGVAVADPSIPDASALLNRADQALFADKRRYARDRRARAG